MPEESIVTKKMVSNLFGLILSRDDGFNYLNYLSEHYDNIMDTTVDSKILVQRYTVCTIQVHIVGRVFAEAHLSEQISNVIANIIPSSVEEYKEKAQSKDLSENYLIRIFILLKNEELFRLSWPQSPTYIKPFDFSVKRNSKISQTTKLISDYLKQHLI